MQNKLNKQIIKLVTTSLALLLLASCSSAGLEKYNRGMYKVNKVVDKYTLKPIAKVYKKITPDPVERGVTNFFSNLSEIPTFTNSLLQGKLKNATLTSARFVWNSTIGIGGIFDVASSMKIYANKEDFGQTLRYWGTGEGPYVILPVLGPSTTTDMIGRVGDYAMSPLRKWDWTDHKAKTGQAVLSGIDTRARILKLEDLAAGASTDEYEFVKNIYLQKRRTMTRDNKVDKTEDDKMEDEFDDLFEDDK